MSDDEIPWCEPNYMTRAERETALEVLASSDLTLVQKRRAMYEINQRARIAPFNAYNSACAIVGRMTT